MGPGFLFSRVNSRFQRLHHRVTLRRWIAHIRMLLKNGKITKDRIALLDQWQYTGFNIYCGQRILPWEKTSMENLALYIIRASFSQERMTYVPEAGSVLYQSKDGRNTRLFDALEWSRRRTAGCKHSLP